MAKKSRMKKIQRKELLDKGYLECYYCNELVNPRALKCSHCGKWYSSGKQLIAFSIAVIVVLSVVVVYYYLPSNEQEPHPSTLPSVVSASPTGTTVSTSTSISVTFNKVMNKSSVESAFSLSPHISGTFSWSGRSMTFNPSGTLAAGTSYTATIAYNAVDTYGNHLDCEIYRWFFTTEGGSTARREVGSGEDDFWIRSVNHPSWVVNDVESKVVLIFTHSEGCAPCVTQTGICESIYSTYSSNLKYYDLLSGTNEPEATETFSAYDPDGEPHYVPLTIVLTKGPNNVIIWHSWEGVIDEQALSSWIEDAISYHNEN